MGRTVRQNTTPPLEWQRQLRQAARTGDTLLREVAPHIKPSFPVVITESFMSRIRPEDPNDPLLLQVLWQAEETADPRAGFGPDPTGEFARYDKSGMIRKYQGRALLITTSTCAIHCRYCFRREFPYEQHSRQGDSLRIAIEELENDPSIHELILSGGDPLTLTTSQLKALFEAAANVSHLRHLRIHTRMLSALPERFDGELMSLLNFYRQRFQIVLVHHINHPNELAGVVFGTARRLHDLGIVMLNQSVLLKRINDDLRTQTDLAFRLFECGILPYYIHQLDRVHGSQHFEVSLEEGRKLYEKMRATLPGYLLARYVTEQSGSASKIPLA